MEKDLKDLLLKDLCARLPYGVKLDTLEGPQELDIRWLAVNMCNVSNPYLPYLFHLSSMTDEQIYKSPFGYATMDTIRQGEVWSVITIQCKEYNHIIDWLNKNHFDYRGLIEKGLAIDATGLNVY